MSHGSNGTDKISSLDEKYTIDDDCGQSFMDRSHRSSSYSKMESSETERVIVAEKEAKEVKRFRALIILVLLMSGIGAISVYFYSKSVDNNNFENKFYDDANKVLSSLGAVIDKALGGLDALALTIVTTAQHTNQTFPFVTVLDYPLHASRAIALSKTMLITYAPIVTYDQRLEWEKYMSRNGSKTSTNESSMLEKYVTNALQLQEGWRHYYGPKQDIVNWPSSDVVFRDSGPLPYYNGTGTPDIYLPMWHSFPLVMAVYPPAGYDFMSTDQKPFLPQLIKTHQPYLTYTIMVPRPDNPTAITEATKYCPYFAGFNPPGSTCMEPVSSWNYPVIQPYDEIDIVDKSQPNATNVTYTSNNMLKGMLWGMFYWRELLKDILPESSRGMIIVTENSCQPDDPFTYQIDGPYVKYLGVGDWHQSKYSHLTLSSPMFDLNSYRQGDSDYYGLLLDEDQCKFTFTLYASEEMSQEFQTNTGIIFAVSAALFVLLPILVFILYDRKVSQQQKVLTTSATRSNAIIDSLFPSNVRDKLYDMDASHNWLLDGDGNTSNVIADLYPETTVIFVDIADFTVWSSVRDPFQVFTLLECLYSAYDRMATRRKIFKVETVGDSYIAVCGLPTPNKNHAVVMAKFAKGIQLETTRTVVKLEKRLGPGTGDLLVRVGLNSGPTTAGVLRGAKGRFQLFGDTVNTASRMESNSKPGKIMCTEKTANLLMVAGKQHWLTRRDDLVNAKGKGLMTCYWVNPRRDFESSNSHDASGTQSIESDTKESNNSDSDLERLVDWMTEMFADMLQDVVCARGISPQDGITKQNAITFLSPREEVTETIELPARRSLSNQNQVNSDLNRSLRDPLTPETKSQIREYITMLSKMYQPNPFHNFEHACHVVMVAKKLLARVVKPNDTSVSTTAYGITSDPLTQFAIIFSALIHDVDHPGVSNAQLVKEKHPMAQLYHDLSVAEQNSVTLSWDLLMQPRFGDFRNLIMTNEVECRQFRQILVNSVVATDLFDKDLKTLRDNRWNVAFGDNALESSKLSERDSNRRATIVIEHVLQAADVSHTMQHWHVYQKWNKRLLREMYLAYKNGRSEKDPTIGWYGGELWFFDNYIIPLAKKLKTCGVFGVSCDELLDYALENRAEWVTKGQQVVEENLQDLLKQVVIVGENSRYIGNEFDKVLESTHDESSNDVCL